MAISSCYLWYLTPDDGVFLSASWEGKTVQAVVAVAALVLCLRAEFSPSFFISSACVITKPEKMKRARFDVMTAGIKSKNIQCLRHSEWRAGRLHSFYVLFWGIRNGLIQHVFRHIEFGIPVWSGFTYVTTWNRAQSCGPGVRCHLWLTKYMAKLSCPSPKTVSASRWLTGNDSSSILSPKPCLALHQRLLAGTGQGAAMSCANTQTVWRIMHQCLSLLALTISFTSHVSFTSMDIIIC